MPDTMPTRGIVLLIDDDPGDHELTRRVLAGGGLPAEFRGVSGGDEALEYLRRTGRYAQLASEPLPAMILLDLNMPGRDGRDILRELRADPHLRTIPVVMLTTSSRRADMAGCWAAGCDDFLTKPTDLSRFAGELQQVVCKWLKTRSAEPRGDVHG